MVGILTAVMPLIILYYQESLLYHGAARAKLRFGPGVRRVDKGFHIIFPLYFGYYVGVFYRLVLCV